MPGLRTADRRQHARPVPPGTIRIGPFALLELADSSTAQAAQSVLSPSTGHLDPPLIRLSQNKQDAGPTRQATLSIWLPVVPPNSGQGSLRPQSLVSNVLVEGYVPCDGLDFDSMIV